MLFCLPWAQTHLSFKGTLETGTSPAHASRLTAKTEDQGSLSTQSLRLPPHTRLPFQAAPVGSTLASACTLLMMGNSLLSKVVFPASLYCYKVLTCKFLYVLYILYINSYKLYI